MTEHVNPGPLVLSGEAFPSQQALLVAQARAARRWIIAMSAHAKTGHVGSCLSPIDVLVALYFHAMRVNPLEPAWPDRDRMILSKGHAAAALYTVLAARGFIPADLLWTYLGDGSALAGHVVTRVPGVELSTGSLGHGLGVGAGLALGAKHAGASWRTFVVLSDGECDEGSTWEAALSAGANGLDRLVAIVDANQMQALGRVSDVMPLEPLAEKWRSFGWNVVDLDGHDLGALCRAFDALPAATGKPTAIIARTILGKGVSFMEDRVEWHYLTPTADQVIQALAELA